MPKHTEKVRKAKHRTPSLVEIEEFVSVHIRRSINLVNGSYKTDSDTSVTDYHKGFLNALIEVKRYMKRGKKRTEQG
jgi:hypothetical protein